MKRRNSIDGLPDWRDASQYPDPRKTKNKQWAWEFLRRNPDYRKDFYKKIGKNNLTYEVFNKPVIGFFEKKYRVKYPLSPAVNSPPNTFRFVDVIIRSYNFDGIEWLLDHSNHNKVRLEEGEFLVRINSNMPIKPQIDRIKRHVKTFDGSKTARKSAESYDVYLRTLDALESGAEVKEIAAVLFPKIDNSYAAQHPVSKKIRDTIKPEALRLRSTGYHYIGIMPD